MTNLKKEFFFLRRQLRKRFFLFLLGVLLYVMFSSFFSCNAHTYNSISEIPENHVGNFKFMNYAGPEFVNRDGNEMVMNNFVHEYKIDDGQYKITFALPANVAAVFSCVMLALFIFSVIQRLDWFNRYLLDEANKKVHKRRAAMNELKKELKKSKSRNKNNNP